MKNALLCAVLGIGVIVCAFSYDYVSADSEYREQLSEKVTYAELNADMHKRYGGYSIDELCEGYITPNEFLGKTEIAMPVTNQYPELPVGCEITCAAALLNFLGYDIDKCDLANNYLVQDSVFTEKDGILYGPNPYEVFVGDPYSKGYGCYKQVIADVLDDYLSSHGSDYRAVILEDSNSADIDRLIDGGVPIIVWASIDMKPYRYNAVSEWTASDGTEIMWLSNSHTLILTGYDAAYYYFMDCSDKTEIQRYPRQTFIDRWEENGKQSIVVKRK